jgi:hypothetical protein
MKRPMGLFHVPLAARQAAMLLFGAVLFTAMGLLDARPAQAACAYVEGGRAYFAGPGGADLGQQITIHIGYQPFMNVIVRLSDGRTADVTDVCAFASGGKGYFPAPGDYQSVPADANKQFPLYAIYRDPCTGTFHTFTVSLHVIP